MPTMRLNDEEKSTIRSAFNRVLDRSLNNIPFPVTKDEFDEFAYSLLDDTTRSHYEWLRENKKKLAQSACWHPSMEFLSPEGERYTLQFGSDTWLPYEDIVMEETNLRYDEVWQWTRRYCEIYDRVKSASGFVTDVVEHCCTAGQIKRVMQDEILTFLPTYIRSSFNDAERQSRWPSSLPSDCWDDLKTLADTLALGSLSPKDLQGTQVSARKLS